MKGKFDKFWQTIFRPFRFLFNRSPWVYGLTYILMIPTFALIFNITPRSFYLTTANYELDFLNNLILEIQNDIDVEFKKSYAEIDSFKTIVQIANDNKVFRQTLKNLSEWVVIAQLKVEGDSVSFNVFFPFNVYRHNNKFHTDIINERQLQGDSLSSGKIHSLFSNKYKFDFIKYYQAHLYYDKFQNLKDAYPNSMDEYGDYPNEYFPITATFKMNNYILYFKQINLEYEKNLNLSFLDDFEENDLNSEIRILNNADLKLKSLNVSENTINKLIELISIKKGIPSTSLKNLKRMFYFSTVTITTLGFGDIVPITDNARTLTSIEAILGVVVIGLFLNSLSKKN